MPEYYPGVDRDNPLVALVAGARTMRHYLEVFEGDVCPALASYNAGLGRVQSLMANHGANWEQALPAETKGYLAAIAGDAHPQVQLEPRRGRDLRRARPRWRADGADRPSAH